MRSAEARISSSPEDNISSRNQETTCASSTKIFLSLVDINLELTAQRLARQCIDYFSCMTTTRRFVCPQFNLIRFFISTMQHVFLSCLSPTHMMHCWRLEKVLRGAERMFRYNKVMSLISLFTPRLKKNIRFSQEWLIIIEEVFLPFPT